MVIESDLWANVCIFALMNVSSRCWSPFHADDFVFSRNEQQKVYQNNVNLSFTFTQRLGH